MDLEHSLTSTLNYERACIALINKIDESPHRFGSSPGSAAMTLDWMLRNRASVIQRLTREIRGKKFTFSPARLAVIKTDKPRDIVVRPWPERLVEHVLAESLHALIDKELSDAIHSFRKGRGSHSALGAFADFVRKACVAGQPVFVCKFDVKQYDKNIDHGILLRQLHDCAGPQSAYIWGLIEQLVSPEIQTQDGQRTRLKLGLPMGSPLTPELENLYLTPVDRAIAAIGNVFYLRYGDDLILASSNDAALTKAIEVARQQARELNLTFKDDKTVVGSLGVGKSRSTDFTAGLLSIDYLGMSVSGKGVVTLSPRKRAAILQEINAVVDHAFHRQRLIGKNHKSVKAIVAAVNQVLSGPLRHPYIQLALNRLTDDVALKALDLAIAKRILKPVFGTAHDRVFKRYPYSQLRADGLYSLVHLRRMSHATSGAHSC